jgi:hypothetical protein
MKGRFSSPIITTGPGLAIGALRHMAQAEPKAFAPKVQGLVDSGKLALKDLHDLRSLYRGLADVEVQVSAMVNGVQRTITSQAFPVLVGTTVVGAINSAADMVETVGQFLVTEMDDNKKITTLAQVETLDVHKDKVAELEDFPEIGAGERTVEIRHRKNGRKLSISVEAILENNLADITSRVNKLGTIAMETIEELTLARVTDHYGSAASPTEPYVYRPEGTGTTLFSATANTPGVRAPSGNRVENNAFVDYSDLEAARIRMATMLNERGKRVAIPRSEIVLLVPDAILDKVLRVVQSEYVPGVENELNSWGPAGKFHIPVERVLSTPKLDDLSATAWYYGAFARQFVRKWKMRYEIVTLGQDTQAYLNNQIAFQARIAWDCEVGAVDYTNVLQCLSATTAPYDD